MPAPSEKEIVEVLKKVSKKEGISLPDELAERIAATSELNLRRAILSLEATKVKQCVPPIYMCVCVLVLT